MISSEALGGTGKTTVEIIKGLQSAATRSSGEGRPATPKKSPKSRKNTTNSAKTSRDKKVEAAPKIFDRETRQILGFIIILIVLFYSSGAIEETPTHFTPLGNTWTIEEPEMVPLLELYTEETLSRSETALLYDQLAALPVPEVTTAIDFDLLHTLHSQWQTELVSHQLLPFTSELRIVPSIASSPETGCDNMTILHLDIPQNPEIAIFRLFQEEIRAVITCSMSLDTVEVIHDVTQAQQIMVEALARSYFLADTDSTRTLFEASLLYALRELARHAHALSLIRNAQQLTRIEDIYALFSYGFQPVAGMANAREYGLNSEKLISEFLINGATFFNIYTSNDLPYFLDSYLAQKMPSTL